MSNYLNSGTVLPYGLLGATSAAAMQGFNKSYKNFPLRMGVIVNTFPVSDPNNIGRLTTEYNVVVIEQHEDKSATTILYKNCMAADGFGGIGDFFEKNLRPLKKKTTKKDSINLKGQDGTIVLLLCQDAVSDKAIIIGCFPHPDRKTTLQDDKPHLEGEYNGVHWKINSDGTPSLVFKGAIDNSGKVIDPSQGPTSLQIKPDGSVVLKHSTVTLDLERSGDATLTVTGNGNVTINANKDVTVNAQGNVNANCENATITAKEVATVEGQTVKLGKSATESVIKGDTFQKYFNQHFHPTAVGPSGPPVMPMPNSNLSTKVKTE